MLCTLCDISYGCEPILRLKNTIRESREEISSAYVISAADKAEVPVAGVCRVLSGYSFTTESDEATGITKNPRTMVASTAPSDAAEEVQTPLEEAETPEAKVQAASGEAEAPEAAESKPATVETTTGAENRWNITLTQEEMDLLAKIVWLESQGEPTEGQEAVVEVVLTGWLPKNIQIPCMTCSVRETRRSSVPGRTESGRTPRRRNTLRFMRY